MYKEDGLSQADIQVLVDMFKGQTLDFFGAVRASTYDNQIRDWMVQVSGEKISHQIRTRLVARVVECDILIVSRVLSVGHHNPSLLNH